MILPITGYALAFEYLGTSTKDWLADKPYTYSGTTVTPKNRDEKYLGTISLQQSFDEARTALLWLGSKLFEDYNLDTFNEYPSSFKSKPMDYDSGIFRYFSSQYASADPETISNGYQMILNGGNFKDTRFINQIITLEDNQSHSINYSDSNPLSSQASFLVLEMLKSTYQNSSNLSLVNNKPRDYTLYDYADVNNIALYGQIPNYITTVSSYVVGNADFSITSFALSNKNSKNKTDSRVMQDSMNALLDSQESKYNLQTTILRPEGLIETNYAPGILGDNNLDAHSSNDTSTPNIGLQKDQ